MNVLSLFDGMSCGQIALKQLGVSVDRYYASEIDKHAIAQTQHNFPSTIQLGSVTDVDVSKLEPIDLLIGGSPCQSFSFAGKRNGMSTKCSIEVTTLDQYLTLKQEGFEFEGQSYLFWEYMRILTEIRKYNPNVKFLLENVEMGMKWEYVLSTAIGVFGVHIDSALVSAQRRKRVYWTNIRTRREGLFGDIYSDIPQPIDRGVMLSDILDSEVDEKYFLTSDKVIRFVTDEWRQEKKYTQIDGEKSLPQLARQYASWCGDYVREVIQLNPSKESGGKQPYQQNRVYDPNGISPALCADKSDLLIREATSKGYARISPGECFDYENPNSSTRRGRKMAEKSNCLMAKQTEFMQYTPDLRIRRLTPLECSRLQTVPEWYSWKCPDSQAYRMLGNGWTVDVISHILGFMH